MSALAAQIMIDMWRHHNLGAIPRTESSIGSLVDMLADDVHRAAARLSDSAFHTLAANMEIAH